MSTAFEELKEILTSDLILQLPNFSKPFRFDTDACNLGIGASFEQPTGEAKEWKPVAYFSKHLSVTQQKYSTTERELLAIVLACEHFRQRLYGVRFQVVSGIGLYMWKSRMEMFDMEITYREGETHGNADGLSRMAADDEMDDEDTDTLMQTPINTIRMLDEHDEENCESVDFEEMNFIRLQVDGTDSEQFKDKNIVWIHNIIMQEQYY